MSSDIGSITSMLLIILFMVCQQTDVMATKIIQDTFQSGCSQWRYVNQKTSYSVSYGDNGLGYTLGCVLAYSSRDCGKDLPICATFVPAELPCTGRRLLILVLMNDTDHTKEYYCTSQKRQPIKFCGQSIYMYLNIKSWQKEIFLQSETSSYVRLNVTCTSPDTVSDTDDMVQNVIIVTTVSLCSSLLIIIILSLVVVIRKRKRNIENLSERDSQRGYPYVQYSAIPNEYVQMQSNTSVQDQNSRLQPSSGPVNQGRYRLRVPAQQYRTRRGQTRGSHTIETHQETTNERQRNEPFLEVTSDRRHTDRARQEIHRDRHSNISQSHNQYPTTVVNSTDETLPYHYCHLQVIEGPDNM